jgi:hypothetical protein
VADDDRQTVAGPSDLTQQLDALRRVGRVKRERHVEARQQIAKLIRPLAVLVGDDPKQREVVRPGVGPAREELAHSRIQPALGEPRLDEVVIDLTERHRRNDRVSRRVVALDEQDPLGHRVQGVSAREELHPGHLRHLLVRDQQRNRLDPVRERRELCKPRRGAVDTDDPRVVPEASIEIRAKRLQHRRIGGDEEDDRRALVHRRVAAVESHVLCNAEPAQDPTGRPGPMERSGAG